MSIRILWLSAFLRSPAFRLNVDDVLKGALTLGLLDSNPEEKKKAAAICDHILQDFNDYDLIALCEVWDEDCKKVMVSVLRQKYPYYVAKISGEARAETGLIEDSGLMLFSKYPFQPFCGQVYKEMAKHYGIEPQALMRGSDSPVYFTQYWGRAGVDRLAAKGAAVIRIRIDRYYYNIVWTHLQADSDHADVRLDQLYQLQRVIHANEDYLGMGQPFIPNQYTQDQEEIYIFGDFNIFGRNICDDPAADQAFVGDYTEWSARFGKQSDLFYPMYDVWAWTTSEWDRGFTYSGDVRYDYVFANGHGWWHDVLASYVDLESQKALPGHTIVQHITCPRYPASDHRAIAVDINYPIVACCPRIAWRIPKIIPSHAPLGTWTDPVFQGSLRYSGSMQWYKIEQPGTYTFRLPEQLFSIDSNPKLAIDVYAKEDLTAPIDVYQGLISRSECVHWDWVPDGGLVKKTEMVINVTYHVPEAPFYVRVFSRNSEFPHPHQVPALIPVDIADQDGAYHFYIHKNGGSSPDDPIIVGQNLPLLDLSQQIDATAVGSGGPVWLRFDVGRAASGLEQSIKFTVQNDSGEEARLELLDENDLSIVESWADWSTETLTIEKQMVGPSTQGRYMRLQRLSNQTAFRVGWTTNLQFFVGYSVPGAESLELYIKDETGWDVWGSDEIILKMWADDHTLIFNDHREDMDTGEPWYLDYGFKNPLYGDLPVVGFLHRIRANAVEEDLILNDEGGLVIHALQPGPDDSRSDALRQYCDIPVSGGLYQLRWSLTWKRPNLKNPEHNNDPQGYGY